MGESEKCCGYRWAQAKCFQRERYSDDASLMLLLLLRQEQSSFEETEVEIDFHLMVETRRFFKKTFILK